MGGKLLLTITGSTFTGGNCTNILWTDHIRFLNENTIIETLMAIHLMGASGLFRPFSAWNSSPEYNLSESPKSATLIMKSASIL